MPSESARTSGRCASATRTSRRRRRGSSSGSDAEPASLFLQASIYIIASRLAHHGGSRNVACCSAQDGNDSRTEAALKKILVLCPTRREYRDLPAIAESLGYELVFDDFCGDYFDRFLCRQPPSDVPRLDILGRIENTVARYRDERLSGVTSGVGYPGMSVASIVAHQLGLPGPAPASVMCCEHKYYSRKAQQALVPDAVPEFHLLDPRDREAPAKVTTFPVFLKPVKSCMSINAHRVYTRAQLEDIVRTALLPEGFIAPFDDMVRAHTDYPLDASHLLVESLLEGTQVSLEGYVYRGEVHVMGILDAVMFPHSISFRRFQYPSRLSEAVQLRMAEIARRFITGIGYDNAPFNIELFYDARTDGIHVIEVNPKIASQFADLIMKVDGQSSFSVLLQLAAGEEPRFVKRNGEFAIAGSCVLRTFDDRRVLAVPSQEELDDVVAEFPDATIEIHATPGRLLSEQMQDSQSFRYGLVHIGAGSEVELEQKFAHIAGRLRFEFEPVQANAPATA